MLKRIKVLFREWNDVTKGMEEAPKDTTNLEFLPINMEPKRAEYEKLGFCFYKWRYKGARGKMDEMSVDQVMCLAKLPEGWVIKEMTGWHKEIIDESGKRRVVTFFKNELGDRRGFMRLL